MTKYKRSKIYKPKRFNLMARGCMSNSKELYPLNFRIGPLSAPWVSEIEEKNWMSGKEKGKPNCQYR